MGLHETKLPLVSAGLDYLTLTSTASSSKRAMWRFFNAIVAADLKLGHKIKSGGAYGFYGKRARHALLAEKEDRMMLQVSGQAAQRSFKLMRDGDNATRIDIQVTFRVPPGGVQAMLAQLSAEARSAPAVRGHKPEVTDVVKTRGIETVYIGVRKSDVFLRLYDKFAESKEDRFKDCVRLEAEIKGKTAKALWRHCASNGLGPGYLLSVLRGLLERRGLQVGMIDWISVPQPLPPKEKTSQETTRAWWSVQVAPSVARDASVSGWYAAFCILFERCLTELDRCTILKALSVAWGN